MSLEDKLYPLLSIYERLPRGPKWAAGFVYRQLPETFRRGKSYREFKQLAEEGEHWNQNRIEEFQFQELRRVLHHAQEHCAFYRERFQQYGFDAQKFETFDDLAK